MLLLHAAGLLGTTLASALLLSSPVAVQRAWGGAQLAARAVHAPNVHIENGVGASTCLGDSREERRPEESACVLFGQKKPGGQVRQHWT